MKKLNTIHSLVLLQSFTTDHFCPFILDCTDGMHPFSLFGRGAILGLVSSFLAAPRTEACLRGDKIEVVELQPVEVVCDGKTLTTTATR